MKTKKTEVRKAMRFEPYKKLDGLQGYYEDIGEEKTRPFNEYHSIQIWAYSQEEGENLLEFMGVNYIGMEGHSQSTWVFNYN